MSYAHTNDREQIVRRVYEYAWGIDTRDWHLYRSIFANTVHIDFTSYNPASTAAAMAADDWVANLIPLFSGLDATQHTMTNPLVDIDGDRARCRMYMQAVHMFTDDPDPEFTIGGHYDDQLVRTPDGWRIDAVTLTVTWRRGNPDIMRRARERSTTQEQS